MWARDDAGSRITLRQRMEYGDAGTPDQAATEREGMRARNLLGQLNRHHDEAGLTAVSSVDFKGNVLEKLRQVIADAPILAVFEQAAANGWRVTPFQADWETRPGQTLAERERELLDTSAYRTTSSYDALNRATRLQLPDDVEGKRRELRPEVRPRRQPEAAVARTTPSTSSASRTTPRASARSSPTATAS